MPRYFKIKDSSISCSNCTQTIDRLINSFCDEKIFKCETHPDEKSLFLTVFDTKQTESIKKKIIEETQSIGFFDDKCSWVETDQLGYPLTNLVSAKIPTAPKISISPTDKIPYSEDLDLTSKKKKISLHLWKGLPNICLGILWITLPFLPVLTPLLLMAMTFILAAISSLFILYAGRDIFLKAFKAARYKRINMDTQFAVSIGVAFIISWLAFAITGLPFLFDAALLILGFRHIGQAIEEWAKQKIDKGYSLLEGLPKEVEVIAENMSEEKNRVHTKLTKQLVSGDKIRINYGMILPVDGECDNEGSFTAVDLSGQAGHTFDVQKKGKVLQGYKVMSDFVEIEVKKQMNESTLARLQEQVKKAAAERTKASSAMSYIGANFSKAVFIITLLSFMLIGIYAFFFTGLSLTVAFILALQTALGVLVAACPCTFGSIIPVLDKEAIYKCLENGALVLDPNVLNTMLKAKYLLVDLNGTCTTGEKKIDRFEFLQKKIDPPLPVEKMRAYIKFLEKNSDHLVGEAIYKYLNERHETDILDEKEISTLKVINYGNGLGVKISTHELWVGNKNLLLKKKVELKPGTLPILPSLTQRNYIGYDDQIIGYIDSVEPIRPEARGVLDYFRNEGVHVQLCTGADPETANAYGTLLGFRPEDIKAGCSVEPESKKEENNVIHPKSQHIRNLKKRGVVIFVGDAGNDTTPIGEANIGVAVDSPTKSEACKIGANVYIGQRTLKPLVKMHLISKLGIRARNLSLGTSILYNLFSFAFMGGLSLLWLGFMMHPGLGVVMMVAQALLILIFAAIFQIWPLPNVIPENISEPNAPGAKLDHVTGSSDITHSYNTFPTKRNLSDTPAETPSSLISTTLTVDVSLIESSSPLAKREKVIHEPSPSDSNTFTQNMITF